MRPKRKNSSNALFDAAYDLGTLTPAGAVLSTASKAFQKHARNRSRRNSTDSSVRSPTRTSSDVRSPTRTRTATSTDAYTAGNITVTGGAGAGATKVTIHQRKPNEDPRGGTHAPRNTSKSNRGRVANTAKLQRYLKQRRKVRKNPGDEAEAARYEYFHGRPPAETITFRTPVHDPLRVKHSGIGKLVGLEILSIDGTRVVRVERFRGALLSQDKKGRQLYIDGGDQAVSLPDFGIRYAHDLEILGALLAVVYFTTKDHLDPRDGGTANYDHKFGGEGKQKRFAFGKHNSRLPLVGYDVRNKLLSIQGGGYDLPAEGIDG